MILTNPTHGADGHSGASASNNPNTNPTNGADAYHEGESVNTQEAQPQKNRSFAYDSRPVLTLEVMGKFAFDAARGTYMEQGGYADAIASFYNAVREFFEEMFFLKADDASFLLQMVRPFLEDPDTTQENSDRGWTLTRRLIENMMVILDCQSLFNVSANATQCFSDFRLYI